MPVDVTIVVNQARITQTVISSDTPDPTISGQGYSVTARRVPHRG